MRTSVSSTSKVSGTSGGKVTPGGARLCGMISLVRARVGVGVRVRVRARDRARLRVRVGFRALTFLLPSY